MSHTLPHAQRSGPHASESGRHANGEQFRLKMRGTDGAPVWLVRIEGETPFTMQRMQLAPTFSRREAEDLYVQLTRIRSVTQPEIVPELQANC